MKWQWLGLVMTWACLTLHCTTTRPSRCPPSKSPGLTTYRRRKSSSENWWRPTSLQIWPKASEFYRTFPNGQAPTACWETEAEEGEKGGGNSPRLPPLTAGLFISMEIKTKLVPSEPKTHSGEGRPLMELLANLDSPRKVGESWLFAGEVKVTLAGVGYRSIAVPNVPRTKGSSDSLLAAWMYSSSVYIKDFYCAFWRAAADPTPHTRLPPHPWNLPWPHINPFICTVPSEFYINTGGNIGQRKFEPIRLLHFSAHFIFTSKIFSVLHKPSVKATFKTRSVLLFGIISCSYLISSS